MTTENVLGYMIRAEEVRALINSDPDHRAYWETVLDSLARVIAGTAAVAVILSADIPLQTAGQTSAPTCIEYCEAQS